MSWRKLHLSLAECGSAFSLSVCDGMLEAELRAAVAARLGALAGCERAATDLSWYLTLDGGDGAVVPLSPALLLHSPLPGSASPSRGQRFQHLVEQRKCQTRALMCAASTTTCATLQNLLPCRETTC